MTTAIADINGDGRNDIVLAPMYGGGGLVWYEAPLHPSGSWKRHMIDPTINFVHQGSLQIADFNGKMGGPTSRLPNKTNLRRVASASSTM